LTCVNLGENQINRADLKTHSRVEIEGALRPKNVSPGQADRTVGMKPLILMAMKRNSQNEEENEKKADGNNGFEV
jgi:hypothetical protein